MFTSPKEAAEASEFAIEDVLELNNCQDEIDSIPKLMRDEKNIEDAHKEGNELFLDVCESFRYGVMGYATEQDTPREVLIQREIQKIPSNTGKYIRYRAQFAVAIGRHHVHDPEAPVVTRTQ